ncbi:Chromosome transmission fidelity protein 18-like protein [Rhynchospora pubera]|uniref:Chromosome transmission fidelity protein 18 homolog n=1 Tax=Rhynchospora pubera TaxID=906938 RepID=A0AAV8H810_9POAL|nr:Chromosome transmission fidelity protein 18-like protein [Rhynchospora pubera]
MEMATAEELEWMEMEMEMEMERETERERETETAEEHFSPKTSSKRTRQDQEHEHQERSKRGRPLPLPLPPLQQQEIRISRFASDIQGHCIPITGPAGHRVYAKLNPNPNSIPTATATVAPLLPQSIHTLIQRLENNAFSKALHHSLESIGTDHPPPPPEALQTEQLWVDKYAPTSFTDLLSHEHTNREVLLWLKQWDSLVFGSQVRTTSDDVLSALRIHSSVTQTSKFASNRGFFSKHHISNDQNINSTTETGKSSGPCASHNNKCLVDKPPEQKVLLLCGPPGLGKTTLAHVVAKHCGYRVVEINASDDRSASSIEAKILDVVQMDSVMPDSKPKCLVIDEIDGALGDGKGAVEVILKMVAAERKGSSEKRDVDEATEGQAQAQSRKASSKKRHRVAKLSRPIICICNDLYAPALRQLRQVAKVHTFMQPTVNRVVNRLKYICMKEGFRTNSISLSALAECTECDIRSCLNTLQFLNKKQQPLSIADVDSQVIGRKDLSKSAIDIWKEVFHKKKTKRFVNSVDGQVGSGDDTTQHLFTLISGRGEYELTMDGIHENFLRLSYHDPMMHKTVRCLDLLETSDFLIHYVSKTQQMSIHVYQPAIAVSMSRLIAQVEKPNIEWPKSFQRCRAMLVEKQETLKSWRRRIVPSISRHLSVESFVKDVVSPFLHIITPPNLRPVALNLLSDSEKDDLHQLVDSMVAYSISYKYSKGEPGEKMQNLFADASDDLLLSLEPPISKFINFKGYQSQHIALSIAMKQILVHEVEQQRILQESSRKNADYTEDKTRLTVPQPLTAALANAGKYDKKAAVLEFDEELRLKVEASPGSTAGLNLASHKPSHCNPSFNFFHRFRKESSANTKSQMAGTRKAATTERDLRPLLFKYNEGFTNAVKRPLKIRDLLL